MDETGRPSHCGCSGQKSCYQWPLPLIRTHDIRKIHHFHFQVVSEQLRLEREREAGLVSSTSGAPLIYSQLIFADCTNLSGRRQLGCGNAERGSGRGRDSEKKTHEWYTLTPAVVLLLFIVVVYCVLVLFSCLLVDLKVFAERQEQLQGR